MHIYASDVNEKLTNYIPRQAIGPADTLFYISRRHWLEIVEEFLISFSIIVSVLVFSFAFSVSPWLYLPFVALAYCFPFGIEVFRWKRQIFYLTQFGFYTSYFSLKDMNYHNHAIPFVTGASVIQSTWYGLAGIDVGYFQAMSPDGRRINTPLLPKPLTLRKRLDTYRTYQAPVDNEVKLWNE